MKRIVYYAIMALVFSNWAKAQVYDYHFSDLFKDQFIWFNSTPRVDPQALADSLIQSNQYIDIFGNGEFGMYVVSATTYSNSPNKIVSETSIQSLQSRPPSSTGATITTTGAIFSFDNASGTIKCSTLIGANRQVVTISNLGLTSGLFVLGQWTSGSAFVNYTTTGGQVQLKMRITNDGILMILNLSGGDIYPTYSLSFWPGYVGIGDKVTCRDPGDLKNDFSYLILDNYGGFGVYLLQDFYDPNANPPQKAFVSNSNGYPQYTFRVSSSLIFWTSICPPRSYNASLAQTVKPYQYFGANSVDYLSTQAHKEEISTDPTQTDNPDVLQPYPNLGTFNKWASKITSDNTPYSTSYANLILTGPNQIMYDNWNLSYKPRYFTFDESPSSSIQNMMSAKNMGKSNVDPPQSYTVPGITFLNSLINNAHAVGQKVLMYTSPFGFYTGSPYCDPTLYGPNVSTYYEGNARFPWTTSMYLANTYGDPPGNPEGANRDNYLQSVDTLVNQRGYTNPNTQLDGIYVDGLYTYNIPQSYLLLRKLRNLLGNNRTIFLHTTPRPGNDGYLPQIDSYADFGMFGEDGIQHPNYPPSSFSTYLRYFQGTYNISNTVGILCRDYTWYSYDLSIVTMAINFNLRLAVWPNYLQNYPTTTLLNSLSTYWQSQSANFYNNTPFERYAASENPKYQKMYQASFVTPISFSALKSALPVSFSLGQNYPNPFNPTTTIRYGLPNRSSVRLEIINTLGQQVTALVTGVQETGYHEVKWRANVTSGIYFYRIEATAVDDPTKHFVETKKMLLLK